MVTQFNTETSVRAIYYKEWQIVNKQYMKLKRFKKKQPPVFMKKMHLLIHFLSLTP